MQEGLHRGGRGSGPSGDPVEGGVSQLFAEVSAHRPDGGDTVRAHRPVQDAEHVGGVTVQAKVSCCDG